MHLHSNAQSMNTIQKKRQRVEVQTNMDKASYVTFQWALEETKNILKKAEEDASSIRNIATQQLKEAQNSNYAAQLSLRNASQEADVIVQEALDDADNIRLVATHDASITRQTAEEEFQRFISLFKNKITFLTIECLEELF